MWSTAGKQQQNEKAAKILSRTAIDRLTCPGSSSPPPPHAAFFTTPLLLPVVHVSDVGFPIKKFSNLNHPEFFEILLSLQLGVLLHGEAASGELARIQASFSWQREHCAMGSPSQSRFLRKEIEIRLRAVGNSSLTKHILHTCIENRNKRRRDIEFGELSSVEQNQKIWARRALWSWWVSISCCTVQKHSKSEQRKTPGPLRAQCALCRGGG